MSSIRPQWFGTIITLALLFAAPSLSTVQEHSSTVITYAVPKASHVTLAVYNILRPKVASLFEGVQAVGTHSVAWNGLNDRGVSVSSGVYLLKMQAGSLTQVRKVMLAR